MVLDQQWADKINEMIDLVVSLNQRITALETRSTNRNAMAEEQTVFQYDENILHSAAQTVGHERETQVGDAVNVLELDELTIGKMIVMDSINGHPFADLVLTHRDLNVSEVVVDELILTNRSNYMEIMSKKNLIDDDLVGAATDNFAAPATGVVDTLKVNSLIVDGFINRLDLSFLNEHVLKIRGDQVLESEINFEFLQAASLQSVSISQKQVDHIVRTMDGPFTVDQPIQFANPVFINELWVKDRINNINVAQERFDILLKRADYDQVIHALKIFNEVKLLNPIVLQGKITKSNLNKINPIVSITNDIVLEGNWERSVHGM